MAKRYKTAEEVAALSRGTAFRIRFTRSMSWRDKNAVMYYTANKPVVFLLADGSTVTGTLNETPGAFNPGGKVWIRQPGRKTRKGIPAADIREWQGFRAPTFSEAMIAFVTLSAGGASPEQVAEARSVARDM